MILSTFRRLVPYRLHFLIVFLVSNATYLWRAQAIPVDIVEGSPVPDSTPSYTPEQAREWYDAIGDEGRSLYLQLCVIDLCFLIPSYVLMLGTQFVATARFPPVCYLPVVIVSFDLIETFTHGFAVLGDWKPSPTHLTIAVAATQFKYFGIGMAVLLVIYDGVHMYFYQDIPEPVDKDD